MSIPREKEIPIISHEVELRQVLLGTFSTGSDRPFKEQFRMIWRCGGRYLKAGSTSIAKRASERRAFFGSSPGSCVATVRSVIGVVRRVSPNEE